MRRIDRSTAVFLLAPMLLVVQVVQVADQQRDLLGASARLRTVFAAQQVATVGMVLLLVLAAAVVVLRDWTWGRWFVGLVGVAVALVCVAGAVSYLTLHEGLGQVPFGLRAGSALYLLAPGVLALFAAWLAQAVADPAGEAPDGGLGRGDGVGEAELDRLG